MLPADCELTVEKVTPEPLPYFSVELRAPASWSAIEPGQFLMVRVASGIEPLLRRAFSVHDVNKADGSIRIELLCKVVGTGTAALAGREPGERLWALGPLGRGFHLTTEGPVALVAGGVGSAPLLLLGKRLLELGTRFDFFYGGRSRIDLARLGAFADLAERSGGRLFATTEDGSSGRPGLVTDALEEQLSATDYRLVYACGPTGLLARLAALTHGHGVAGEAALETPMGCGFGACLGCAVRTPEGRFALCCKDGPVFRFDEVTW